MTTQDREAVNIAIEAVRRHNEECARLAEDEHEAFKVAATIREAKP